MDWERRFGGIARLYGEQTLETFSHAEVCVIGIGGVGSWTVEALARSGVGGLRLIDLDHVAESNINRQLPALNRHLGKSKISVMAERIAGINPRCQVSLVEDFISPDNLVALLGEVHFIADCIDNARTKAALVAHCRQAGLSLVTTGGAGGKMDPTRIRLSDLARTEQDPLLAKTRSLLRRDYGFPRDPKRRFGVACVWSDEPARWPAADADADSKNDTGPHCATDERQGTLNCGGLGSCMPVTATFGQFVAGQVLQELAKSGPAR